MGIPMMLTTLGGPAMNFKPSVLAYRRMAEQNGFAPKTLPIATTSLFYVAETTKEALQGMYPHLNVGFQAIRGTGYPKQQLDRKSTRLNSSHVAISYAVFCWKKKKKKRKTI